MSNKLEQSEFKLQKIMFWDAGKVKKSVLADVAWEIQVRNIQHF